MVGTERGTKVPSALLHWHDSRSVSLYLKYTELVLGWERHARSTACSLNSVMRVIVAIDCSILAFGGSQFCLVLLKED